MSRTIDAVVSDLAMATAHGTPQLWAAARLLQQHLPEEEAAGTLRAAATAAGMTPAGAARSLLRILGHDPDDEPCQLVRAPARPTAPPRGTLMRTGDRVDAVLDVITEGNDYRVVMVGVFAPEDHAKIPARDPGAARNVVQTWLGTPHSFGAFRMGRTMPSSEEEG